MTDLEKAKLLAEIDKYENELSTLLEIMTTFHTSSSVTTSDYVSGRIKNIKEKIAMCKRILEEVEEKQQDD